MTGCGHAAREAEPLCSLGSNTVGATNADSVAGTGASSSQTLAATIWSAMRAVLRYRNLKLFCCIAPKRRVVI